MLDVITDFWKPVKKQAPQEAPDLQALQVGTQLSFGTVPQALLSGAKFRVSSINTYQFGEERMTSFVLANENDDHVTLIVANADGEQYLAISRRIPFADRMRMFDPAELEAVAEQPDAGKLTCREIDASFRAWMVSGYRKEISGLRGAVIKGDLRTETTPESTSQPFDYVLLTSDSNEYAIEIERYADGRLEVYATIYRRTTDIVEMENGQAAERKPAAPVLEVVKAEPAAPETVSTPPATPALSQVPVAAAPVKTEVAPEVPSAPAEPVAPVAETKPAAAMPAAPLEASKPAVEKPVIAAAPAAPAVKPAATSPSFPLFSPTKTTQESSTMSTTNLAQANGAANVARKQEIKSVNNNIEQENEAIECDLRAANKIIDEAIRNEMRMSDVVRRIIALPVANPDSVQIPILLTDSDYQLLAIRYGVPAGDHDAIKSRIIEEINDFSGTKKQ